MKLARVYKVIKTCFIGFRQKVLHIWGVMINSITDKICAANDQKCVHIDTFTRKSLLFPKETYECGVSLVHERPEV